MADGGGTFGIGELAMRAGVTPRTVRYYVAEGLLPPPGGAGQNRVYGEDHLLRLRAIRRLKDAYLPLEEIRSRLGGATAEELRRIAEEASGAPAAAEGSRALEYLEAVLGAQRSISPREAGAVPPASDAAGDAWRRVELAPGVELQYRPTGDPAREAAIARLIEEGRRLLGPGGGTERGGSG